MKIKMILAGMAVAISQSAGADVTAEKAALCENFSEMAVLVQASHQKGEPMSSMVNTVVESEYRKPLKEAYLAIIRDGYRRPRRRSQRSQYREIKDFRDAIYSHCIDNF